jgi:hypothetical protein
LILNPLSGIYKIKNILDIMARKPKEINWDLVEKLIEYGSHGYEIAGKFKIDENTFYRRFRQEYKCRFADYVGIGHSGGKADLRLMLWSKAFNNKAPGNAQILLKLASCVLGMREPENTPTLAANQQQIDQSHLIMQLQHRLSKYESQEIKEAIQNG